MKIKILAIGIATTLLSACSSKDTQIADNTFIRGDKIYKVIDNELREVADIDGKVKKFEALKPKQRDFGRFDMSFVKVDAYTTLKALYRGNLLYYNLKVFGINNMNTSYNSHITIEFLDEYGFILHKVEVAKAELTSIVDNDGNRLYYLYSGKTEMSTDINSAISTYNVSAAL